MSPDEGKPSLEAANKIVPIPYWDDILYIGVHPKTFGDWDGDYFLKYIWNIKGTFKIDIVEMQEENIKIAKAFPISSEFKINYIHSRIEDYIKVCKKKYNCIIWWHGPEHMPKDLCLNTIKEFEKICNGIIILGCPNGVDPYDVGYDKHHWITDVKDFENLGYKTILLDRRDRGNPVFAMTAFKKVENE